MTTFALAMLLSALGILPSARYAYQKNAVNMKKSHTGHSQRDIGSSYPLYQLVWTHLVPLAICQLMLALDQQTILSAVSQSSGMVRAFAIAAVGTVLGALFAHHALASAIPAAWKYAAVFR